MHKFRFRSNAFLGKYLFNPSGCLETSDPEAIKFLSNHRKVERLTKPVEVAKPEPKKEEKKEEVKKTKRKKK